MLLRKKLSRSRWMQIVTVCLALGAVSLHYLARVPGISENLADGVAGLFYGIGIGSFVVFAVTSRRSNRSA